MTFRSELFFKDNHFRDQPGYRPASPELTSFLVGLLMRHYPFALEGGPAVEVIDGTNINSGNFRVGRIYLKTLSLNRSLPELELLPRISDALRNMGVPCARFIPSTDGKLITRAEGINPESEGLYIYVQELVPGLFFTGDGDTLAQMLEPLKKLEKGLPEIEPLPSQSKIYADWDPAALLREISARLPIHTASSNPFDQRVRSNWSLYETTCEEAMPRLEKLDLSRLHHIDLHPHNVLTSPSGQLAAVLDLESFKPFPSLSQTAFALLKFGRKAIGKGALDPKGFRRLIEPHWDLRELCSHATIEIFRRITIVLRLHYMMNNHDWDADLSKHTIGLAEARAMFVE